MLTNEELLRKRVIVENKWPGCGFEVGTILYFTDDKIGGPMYVDDLDSGYPSFLTTSEVEPFPYLMRPLHWWADRKPEDLPEYVKTEDGQVYKIKEWDGSNVPYVFVDTKIHTGYVDDCTHTPLYPMYYPASETDYLNYQNTKK